MTTKPFGLSDIPLGPYKMGNNIQDSHIYRPNHSLAEKIINQVINTETNKKRLVFNYNKAPKISILGEVYRPVRLIKADENDYRQF